MSEFEDEIDEFPEEELQLKPEPVGEYLGERNALGERHGKGWAIFPNGDQYDGLYRKGVRHGRGLYVFKNGARYLGNYSCGIGWNAIYYSPKGLTLVCLAGMRSGHGKFIHTDGTVYEGDWRKNKKHGNGTYTYANGDTYCGAWYKDKRHGVGKYTWKDQGIYFEGTWKDGVRVGPCVVQYSKFKFHGFWDYKYPQGPGVFSFGDKHILEGYYISESLFKTNEFIACEKKCSRDMEDEEEEKIMDDEEAGKLEEEEYELRPSTWVSQNMQAFDYSLLPQHPVPLPISDSEASVCDLDSVKPVLSEIEVNAKSSVVVDIEEEEGERFQDMEGVSESESECDFDFDNKNNVTM